MDEEIRKMIDTVKNYAENVDNVYTVYHGSDSDNLTINDIKDKEMWLSLNMNYSRTWGDNIYEIKIKLDKIFDTSIDLGVKGLTMKQMLKYLKSKGINTHDLEYATYKYLDSTEKFIFWEWVGHGGGIAYSWISSDIFYAGYDAIKLLEYGYIKSNKTAVFLVDKPKNKIVSIRKIN
jgi:hypothetical protein